MDSFCYIHITVRNYSKFVLSFIFENSVSQLFKTLYLLDHNTSYSSKCYLLLLHKMITTLEITNCQPFLL